MKVVVKEPGKKPEVREIKNTLKSFQEIVGGFIEAIPFEKGTILVCNEEGKIERRAVNLFYKDDLIVGTVIITTSNFSGEEFIDLTDSQILALSEYFGTTLL